MTEILDKGKINTLTHIKNVNSLLLKCAAEIIKRASEHDNSKFSEQEAEAFAAAASDFDKNKSEVSSPEYEKIKNELGDALKHHYANNSHHPEYYEDGINGMNLFDLLEMLMDWKEASDSRSQSQSIDLSFLQERFGITTELLGILKNTLDFFGFKYHEKVWTNKDTDNK